MKASQKKQAKIVCLSNIFDDSYARLRGERIQTVLSWSKRRDLFACLERAAERELVLISAPPKALDRRRPKWLPATEITFCSHRQFFAANWDAPKIRIPLSWFFYAREVLRRTQDGDLVLLDNYELIYVLAARVLKLFRRVTFILDYEDGKHVVDRGLSRALGAVAEWLGRPLLSGALVAAPTLATRLPEHLPREFVPGFVVNGDGASVRSDEAVVRFIYTGTLDTPRGMNLLLGALPFLPLHGWRLDITGGGPLAAQVTQVSEDPRWRDRVVFHGQLDTASLQRLLQAADVGLNCQISDDPISAVTFPSKLFTYLSAGLFVLSTRASAVEKICGNALAYVGAETPEGFAEGMNEFITNLTESRRELTSDEVRRKYSPSGTEARLREFLKKLPLS